MPRPHTCALFLSLALSAPVANASVYNLKVVTDASPDYSDMDSMIHSIAGKWDTPEEKLWAMFYWTHIGRRQMTPVILHGMALTDPIRQFNDYGFTMCSTVAGMNCAIWDAMGFRTKYWDITGHTVPEVEYGGRWHMYDNSLSALYTLCDGKTIAGVEDIGAKGACEASGGKEEPGHIAKYHCLTATSRNGFLTGSDTARSLDQEYRCFSPNGLMYRYYYYDWDRGHRYILNLRDGEIYTRYYQKQGDGPGYYVPNHGKDPDDKRFHIRGTGVRTYTPSLSPEDLSKSAAGLRGVRAVSPAGVVPSEVGKPGEVVFRIEGANVITSMAIKAAFKLGSPGGAAAVEVSTTNGLHWTEVWKSEGTGDVPAEVKLIDEVNGAYEVLIRASLLAQTDPSNLVLSDLSVRTTTMVNGKTQPKLLLGKNTVYVGAGEQTGSVVLWPDLQGDNWKPYAVDHNNIVSQPKHPGYQGVMHAVKPNEDAYVVFRVDTPGDMTRIQYGGRMYCRAPKSHIDFLHSFDGGNTWTKSYTLTDTAPPWDVIHYVTVNAPPGAQSVLCKYLLNGSAVGSNACSLYSVRMEANYQPPDAVMEPLEVTYTWAERKEDYSLVERSHTQLVSKLPARYAISVGGVDHPVVKSLRVNLKGAVPDAKYGYSDGKDVGGEKFIHRWVTYGKNLAEGRPYTVSLPSNDNWGAGDPEGTKLTDGIVGPPFAGGGNSAFGLGWNKGQQPDITVDLGSIQTCGAFRINVGGGWPWWDSLKGEVEDEVEVLTSVDGTDYTSHGNVDLNLRLKDIPLNHMLPDAETLTAHLFELIPPKAIEARYVRFRVTSQRMINVNEAEVLDFIKYEPFDLRIALPDERTPGSGEKPKVLTAAGRPVPAEIAAKNVAKPLGEPVLDPPTLRSLGAYWLIGGDENETAQVTMQFRPAGGDKWRNSHPLLRVEKGEHKDEKGRSTLDVPEDAWLFAGSALLLEPGTEYELKLTLSDPDGGRAEHVLKARTRAEPKEPEGMRKIHVAPGTGLGNGTAAAPYRGLAAAQAAAQPGDLVIVHAGVYPGTFVVNRSGEPGKPLIWRGAGDGEAILDGAGAERGISANDAHDVWFEGLTIRNANYGFVGHNAFRVVIRRCHIHSVDYGVTCTNNSKGAVRDFFLADNLIEGPSTWPRTKGIENARGVQVTGTGHVVCYNRIRGFADAIDTFPSVRCAAIDFHNNEISEMTDDGLEMDYSERNTRCFHNRLTNVFQGISTQPIFGGPVYIFRNAMYNVVGSPFKMHNNPSGALMVHNTCVKKGMPMVCFGGPRVGNFLYRNNLFIGTEANYAFESTATMAGCDFDYDGFGGGPWSLFLKWNGTRYGSLDEVKQKAPVYTHAVLVDPATAFASGALPPADEKKQAETPPDLRLKEGTAAVDAGQSLPGLNDGFAGAAPDLGAYELGQAVPHYGPRP